MSSVAENVLRRELAMLDFRWIAGIALWTMLIGPVMDFGANRTGVKARVTHVHGR